MNIMLLEKNLQLTEIFQNHLSRELNSQIITVKNSEEGIARMKDAPAINLILCHKRESNDLLNFILSEELDKFFDFFHCRS